MTVTEKMVEAAEKALAEVLQNYHYVMPVDGMMTVIAAALALPAAEVKVKPLVWHKSDVHLWSGDCHTFPANYTIRAADENGWRWDHISGAKGYAHSVSAAKAAAQADHDARILGALAAPSQAREGE